MAGDWIKIEHATPDKRQVFSLAKILGITADDAMGKLIRVWIWADQHTTGCNDSVTPTALLDRVAGVTGFCAAMCSESVGWMKMVGDGEISFVNYSDHNGQTAKHRASTNKRVAQFRKGNDSETILKRLCNAEDVTESVTREEKRREEKIREENKYTPPPPRGLLVDVEVGTGHNSPTGEPPAPMENQTAVTGEKRPKKANKAKKPQIHPTEYSEQFETFWAAYPKHESKSKAFESWEATSLIRPPLAEMLQILATFARQPAWTKDNGQFVPMASTWLNQRRWEDVQVSATAQAAQTERPKRRETHKNGELITDPAILAFDDATWENYKKTMAEYGAYFT
jgi:hypothetical protein